MNKLIIFIMVACLIFSPGIILAGSIQSSAQENEIYLLNNLVNSRSLLSLSGGKCWQSCADDDYGKLNCVTTCDEDGATGPVSSGGGFASPEGLLLGVVLLAGIVAVVWYMTAQSNAANGVK